MGSIRLSNASSAAPGDSIGTGTSGMRSGPLRLLFVLLMLTTG
jgi:hypothetical protein